jgi:hypothetical protein
MAALKSVLFFSAHNEDQLPPSTKIMAVFRRKKTFAFSLFFKIVPISTRNDAHVLYTYSSSYEVSTDVVFHSNQY